MSDKIRIIIAPAEKTKVDQDVFLVRSKPAFLDETQELLDLLKTRGFDQLQDLWRANDNAVRTNQSNLLTSKLDKKLAPAVLAFSEIWCQYLAGDVLLQEELDYLQDRLRILSGFYGVLRPFDGIVPCRLELKTQMTGFGDYSLYCFWEDLPYQELFTNVKTVTSLTSLEYSRLTSPYLKEGQKMITIKSLENKNGKWRQNAAHVKTAHEEMIRLMAKEQINDPGDLKKFSDLGRLFSAADSSEENCISKKRL